MSDQFSKPDDRDALDKLIPLRPAAARDIAPLSEFAAPGGAPAPHRPHLGPPSAFLLLLRRKWLIVGTTLLISAIGIPLIWLFYTPLYSATAVLRIQPSSPTIVFPGAKQETPQYQVFVNTEVSVIAGPAVLERVLDRADVKETQWYKDTILQTTQTGRGGLAEKFEEALGVEPRRGTELIDISISAPKPSDARLMADAVLTEYKKLRGDLDKQSDTQVSEILTSEQATLLMEIDGLIKTRFTISGRLGTDTPEQLRSMLSQHMNQLEDQIHEKQRQQEMRKWELDLLKSAASQPTSGPSGAPPQELRYAGDQEWRQRSFEWESAKHQLEIARLQGGDKNPKVVEAKSNVAYAEKMVKQREAQIERDVKIPGTGPATGDTSQSQSIAQIDMDHRRLGRELELLQKDLERQKVRVTEAGDIALEIASFDERIRQKRELYEGVRQRREQLDMEKKAPARVRVVNYASEPIRPSNDKRLFLSLAVLLGGLGSGLGLGYIRSVLDKRIYEPKELQHIYQAPFLGLLPKLPSTQIPKELGGGVMQLAPDAMVNPRLMLMENMRMIRTTLLERVSQTGERVVLITSSLPNTGKTSVAVLLAQSLAVVGKKVLLVEADLRKPVLAERLGVTSKLGLAALLVGEAKDSEVVMRAVDAKFDLVPAGDLPDQFDPELMANGVFSDCIRRWRESYDFVLLDSPPILRVADAQILAGSADGTIMVLRSSHDRRTEALQAFSQLSAVGGVLLGTVLIGGEFGAKGDRSGYGYGYGSGYGYGYGGYGYGGYGEGGDRFVKHHQKKLAAANGKSAAPADDADKPAS